MNEAELLFSRVLGLSRAGLYLRRDQVLTKDASSRIAAALKRRIAGDPLAYILGRIEFMGLDFKVTPRVLIPRQETEILVEEALKIITARSSLSPKILDLGTGSGCIAITLAKYLPRAGIDAVDISRDALRVAEENAREHGVKLNLMQSDLFGHSAIKPGVYDLILGNPPYVAASEISRLAIEVRREPLLALAGGREGLDFYRRIACGAAAFLKDDGYLMLEMGFGQSRAISAIFREARDYGAARIIADYQGIDRVIIMQRKAGYGQVSS